MSSYSSYGGYIGARRSYRTSTNCVAIGATGPAGPQGPPQPGPTGPQGFKGQKGEMGGPQGATGITGPSGFDLSGNYEIIHAGPTGLGKSIYPGKITGLYYGTGGKLVTFINPNTGNPTTIQTDNTPEEEGFYKITGDERARSQGGIHFQLNTTDNNKWVQPITKYPAKNIFIRGKKVNLSNQFKPNTPGEKSLFPEIIMDSSENIFSVQIGSTNYSREDSIYPGDSPDPGLRSTAGALTISQSASGHVGDMLDASYNNTLSNPSGKQAPASLKFGKVKDNLRLESRTSIPTTDPASDIGPRAGMSFSAQNEYYLPGRTRNVDIEGEAGIILEHNSVGAEYKAGTDLSYNLNFYIKSNGELVDSDLPIMTLANEHEIFVNAERGVTWRKPNAAGTTLELVDPSGQRGPAALQLGSVPTGPDGWYRAAALDNVVNNSILVYEAGATGRWVNKPIVNAGLFGPTGATGAQGLDGVDGQTGMTGWTGAQGAAGAQGFTGWTGLTGAQGLDGVDGQTGMTGMTGMTGAQGAAGAQGFTGWTGVTGAQGIDGVDGQTGMTGMTGMTGAQGAVGAQGFTGFTGMTGLTGLPGFDSNSNSWTGQNANTTPLQGGFSFSTNGLPSIVTINIDPDSNTNVSMNNWFGYANIGDIITVREVDNPNQVGYFEMTTIFTNVPPGFYTAAITYIEGTIDVTAVATSLNGNNYFIGYAPIGPRGFTGMTGMTGAPGLDGIDGANSRRWKIFSGGASAGAQELLLFSGGPPANNSSYTGYQVNVIDIDGVDQTAWFQALQTHINTGGSALMTLVQVTNTVNFQISTVTNVTGPALGVFTINITNVSANTIPANGWFANFIGLPDEFTLSWVLNGPVGITGPTGPSGIPFSKKYLWDVYEPSTNAVIGRAAKGQISLNSIGAFVGNIQDIENTIIGIKEPIYPNGANATYNAPFNNWTIANGTPAYLQNTNTYIQMSGFLGWFYKSLVQYAGLSYSRYDGPFDIIPKPNTKFLPTDPTDIANLTMIWRPDTTAINQTSGNTEWFGVTSADPSNNSSDYNYRLTQCYYVGCASDSNENGNRGYRSFMTDCSAGFVTNTTAGFTSPIKWPKKAPEYGLTINLAGSDVKNGVPFYVDVNFILQIKSEQNEISLIDDFALYGQINYHPRRDETVVTPYIDWSGNTPILTNLQPTYFQSQPGGGGAPFNVLWRDVSNSSVPVPPFRPQYSGDLIFSKSNIEPLSNGPVTWNIGAIIAPNGNGTPTLTTVNSDVSGAIYNIPIHWRAKCYIPDGTESGVNWGSTGNAGDKFDLVDTLNPSLYVALTMFNSNPEWGLNTRAFTYNIILEEDALATEPAPTWAPYQSFVPPGGYSTPKYGKGGWSSSAGFRANMSVTPIL